MASIVKRGKHFAVVYNYINDQGLKKQKWETYKTLTEAKRRKREVEFKQDIGTFIIPQCKNVNDLLNEYINLYGKNNWAISTYNSNIRLLDNYVRPTLGDMKLEDLSTRVIEKYYMKLQKTKAVPKVQFGRVVEGSSEEETLISPSTIREIHKILRNCFNQALKWELMEKNPCLLATVPKVNRQKREIWTAETLFHALEVCTDDRLKMALNLTFACSLRMGELLGLTWNCVDISEGSIQSGTAHIRVNKEVQRVDRDTLRTLENKDVIKVFPAGSKRTKTVLVLKTPKTASSTRKVFLPVTVAHMLQEWKKKQDEEKEFLGEEYQDYNLVFTTPFGMPIEGSVIRAALKKLIEDNDLPPVVFHSFRHASITYKLKLTGDIKAVQGDSGHAQAQMVTDLYSHVLDDSRVHNAELFEEAFYKKSKLEVELDTDGDEDDDDSSADPLLVSEEEYKEVPAPVATQKKRGRPKKSAKNLQSENADFNGSGATSTSEAAKIPENKASSASVEQKSDSSSGSEDLLDQLLKDPEIKKKLLAKLLSDVL